MVCDKSRWAGRLALCFALAWIALATTPAHAAGPDAACTPQFPLESGHTPNWLGADAAYSIPLPDGRDVWIFGDTLYGQNRVVNGDTPTMVRNSIGISTCHAGQWKLNYVIRKDAGTQPQDFFPARLPHTWYWALDGFVSGRDLWVTLLCMRNDPNSKTPAMSFATCGTDLAHIPDPGADPQQWKVQITPLVPDGAHSYPSAAAVVSAGDAYIFALLESGTRPQLATRIPLNGLGNPAGHLQYLARNGKWENGFDPQHAMEVMKQGSPELSIRYHPELHKWLAVMFAPGAFSSTILLRSALRLTGPWTDGETIYKVPEMQPANSAYDKDTDCYAAKEHPEFEHGDLVFTYVCNTLSVPKLATNLNIYYPQVVRMPLPMAAGGTLTSSK